MDAGGDLEVDSGVVLRLLRGAGTTDLFISGNVGITGTLTQQSVSGSIGSYVEVLNGGVLTVNSGGLMNGSGGNTGNRPKLTVDSGGQWTINSGGSMNSGSSMECEITVSPGGNCYLGRPRDCGTTGVATVFDGTVNSTSTIAINGIGDLEIGGASTFGGAVSIAGSINLLNVTRTLTSSANITQASISNLQISGTLTMTAGTLSISRGNGGTMGSINSGGSLILQGSSAFSIGGAAGRTYTVANGGTLDIGPSAVVSGSQLVTSAGSTVKIGSATGVNGNITAASILDVGTNWEFDGDSRRR